MNKQAAAVVVVMFISIMSTLKADLPVVDICLNRPGSQTVPDIDGNVVVWQSDENGTSNTDIYWKHFGDPNDPNTLPLTLNQETPAVSGEVVVWLDRRLSADRDIYAYDIVNRAYIPLRAADGANQRGPDIAGQYIVCEHYNSVTSNYNVVVFNFQTNQYDLISPVAALQTNIFIDGSVVVWRDDRDGKKQIYMCDLSVKPYAAQAVSPGVAEQWRPAVGGDLIVWEDHTNDPDFDLVVYSISAGTIIWTCSNAGEQSYPAVSGSIIVWQEKLTGRTDYDIRGYDISTGAYFDIATSTKNDQFPAISGRRVVWQRDNATKDIVGAVIPTPAVIAVMSPNGGEEILAGSAMEISWQMMDGTAPDNVKIEFSSNNGTTWETLATGVPFANPYLWEPVNTVDSTECLIRVSDAADSLVSDISDAPFTVFQCDAALTADLTGDCFVGLDDFAEFAAQWLVCGNLSNPDWCVTN
jgi:beta propeller repeat protein